MKGFNSKKIDFLIILVAYIGTVSYSYFTTHTGSLLFSSLLAIPGTFLVLIFGSVLLEIVTGIVKSFIRWLKR